jgi:arabinofuranan 3-O-arabinosyltransferase
VPPRERVRRPTLVRLRWDSAAAPAGLGDASPALAVEEDGTVRLPVAARGQTFRLEILRAAFPRGTPGTLRQRRAVGLGELRGEGVPRVAVRREGRIPGRCGELRAAVGERALRMRLDATLADLDAGRPLRTRACGRPVALPAGATRLSLPAGTFTPYLLRLRSPAPAPAPTPASPGRVVDPGDAGRNTWRDVRLDLREPAWLVLGQAYSDAWRAECDGRDLGAPAPVDGFAMGWRVPADCRSVDMAFGPDRLVRAGYLVSAPFLLAMLLLVALRRPPRPALETPPALLPEAPAARPLPVARAALIALAAGAVLGFVFAARAAPLIAVGVFVVLWRGVGVRPLVTAAGALLLVAVPILTLAIDVEDRGGYNPEYAQARMAVHWVVVAAVVLLMLALARALGAARRRRSPA